MKLKKIHVLVTVILLLAVGGLTFYIYMPTDKADAEVEEFEPGGGDFRGGKGATGSW